MSLSVLLTGLGCSQLGIHLVDLFVGLIAHVAVVAADVVVDDAADVVAVVALAALGLGDRCQRDATNYFETGHFLIINSIINTIINSITVVASKINQPNSLDKARHASN